MKKNRSILVNTLCLWCAVARTGAFVFHPGAYSTAQHRVVQAQTGGVTSSIISYRNKVTTFVMMKKRNTIQMNMKSNEAEGEKINMNISSNSNKWQKNMQKWQKNIASCALALLLFFSTMFSFTDFVSAGETGGRMGGSFSAPSRSSYSAPSRSSMRSSSYGGSGYSPRFSRGYTMGGTYSSPGYYGSSVVVPVYSRPLAPVGFFFNGAFFLATAFVLSSILNGAAAGSSSDAISPLGKGVSVVSFSVALNVPRRDDPSSILSYLKRTSDYADTGSRSGLQNLVSQVALELLRQRKSVVAASSQYKHYKSTDDATREFNRWAITQRSKYEKETISKFKGNDYSNPVVRSNDEVSYQATIAVVTLILAIEGDSTVVPVPVDGTGDVADALSKIAADAKVEDCLLGAEILWAPGDASETLSEREIYADYPELRSI
mmetsp:Transcript_32861/g.47557  ORF Transcript_32861/g.47557 Transcript_32861/m.47557 type:complete len:433 (-) Transcript_32861:914-2212(-)|eukprot:CAMPEP_0116036182 /NCGR_PEP_ID=MMETSP0321-20121206/20983_1 /TAXON_ID=163516 /ORGANISM="Leptocylindrus danicus var. danicus, Strain B650" /LENGTH=432 /DNA_ID=CAMNT_0003513501 /DNA_START=30 /DNA_END=1328 /DNA_ORIENTATION=+